MVPRGCWKPPARLTRGSRITHNYRWGYFQGNLRHHLLCRSQGSPKKHRLCKVRGNHKAICFAEEEERKLIEPRQGFKEPENGFQNSNLRGGKERNWRQTLLLTLPTVHQQQVYALLDGKKQPRIKLITNAVYTAFYRWHMVMQITEQKFSKEHKAQEIKFSSRYCVHD